MRFWQALVTAQMAGGAVWADRYHDVAWVHLAADTANVLLGLAMWRICEWLSGATPVDQ